MYQKNKNTKNYFDRRFTRCRCFLPTRFARRSLSECLAPLSSGSCRDTLRMPASMKLYSPSTLFHRAVSFEYLTPRSCILRVLGSTKSNSPSAWLRQASEAAMEPSGCLATPSCTLRVLGSPKLNLRVFGYAKLQSSSSWLNRAALSECLATPSLRAWRRQDALEVLQQHIKFY